MGGARWQFLRELVRLLRRHRKAVDAAEYDPQTDTWRIRPRPDSDSPPAPLGDEPAPVSTLDTPEPDLPDATLCARHIVHALRAARRRLTLPELLGAIPQYCGRTWAERTVKRYLRVLRQQGHIDHDKDADPPGYGLPGTP